MYQVSFKVKDLDGFSFSVEQMDKVLRPDAQQSQGDTLDTVVPCVGCGSLDKVGNMADGITNDGGLTFRYVCGNCRESCLCNSDSFLMESLDGAQHDTESPAEHVMDAYIGTPGRFQRNPAVPDENPSKPAPRVEMGLRVTVPCGVCAGQGEIVSFTGKSGQTCKACNGEGETLSVVSLNAILSAQGISFDAEKAMVTAFELSKIPF